MYACSDRACKQTHLHTPCTHACTHARARAHTNRHAQTHTVCFCLHICTHPPQALTQTHSKIFLKYGAFEKKQFFFGGGGGGRNLHLAYRSLKCFRPHVFFSPTDVNECTDSSHNCHQDATCTNTNGSFTCQCTTAYSGNGTACQGIDCWARLLCQQECLLKNIVLGKEMTKERARQRQERKSRETFCSLRGFIGLRFDVQVWGHQIWHWCSLWEGETFLDFSFPVFVWMYWNNFLLLPKRKHCSLH